MEKDQLIEKLNAIPGDNWENGMGLNSVNDFVTVPNSIIEDTEIMDALWNAIENRIKSGLVAAGNQVDADTLGKWETWQNRVWENWCNELIDIDFSDIQKMIDEYDI